MRSLSLLLVGAALAACSTAPPPPSPMNAEAEAQLQRMLAGKVAGPAVNCLPRYRSNDMFVIDEHRIAFRDNADRVWVTTIPNGCPGIGWGHNTLLFRHLTTGQLCSGEIAQVIDATTGVQAGSCALGPFVPYSTPGT